MSDLVKTQTKFSNNYDVYRMKIMSLTQVFRYVSKFKNGQINLKNKQLSGAPSKAEIICVHQKMSNLEVTI